MTFTEQPSPEVLYREARECELKAVAVYQRIQRDLERRNWCAILEADRAMREQLIGKPYAARRAAQKRAA